MTDVAEPSGPAVAGAGGPVIAGRRFLAVAEITGASGPKNTEAGGPVMTGTRFRTVTDVVGASGPETDSGQFLMWPEPIARPEPEPVARS